VLKFERIDYRDPESDSEIPGDFMRRHCWILLLILILIALPQAFAQQGIIVRDALGSSGINATCLLLSCKVSLNLGDPAGQVFLITIDDSFDLPSFLTQLQNQVGVVGAEIDQELFVIEATAGPIPESLLDSTPVPYYGAAVWDGYANQPAAAMVRLQQAQVGFGVTGAGTVAMIDTGVDTQHPALVPVLVPGYNFINNTPSGSEMGDVNESSAAVLDGGSPAPAFVNSSTIAVVNESTAAVLDGGPYSAFGHGTMTAGIVHLVAPTAKIMPLKAFSADGTGYLSNIIRAAYYAVNNGGKVISMSFSLSSYSGEMSNAIRYANKEGVICVASAGNSGEDITVYPAGLKNVMGVASTSDYDTRSTFSNYGPDVWVAAPGEGVISTYPYGTYSAGWGTSFSAPFVSGTAALLVGISPNVNQQSAAAAMALAQYIPSSGMGNGLLNIDAAVQFWIDSPQNNQ
jgi:subtilisin family serine protease